MDTAETYEVQTHKAISETLDNETIIINLETGTYYSLNTDGSALWNAIVEKKLISIQNSTIASFISKLLTDGLIQKSQDPATLEADTSLFQNPSVETYTDMQEMLLADPIHDVDQAGWPILKKEE